MTEHFTTTEGLNTCPVCHMDIPDIGQAIKHEDEANRETLLFCSEACYKQYMENPAIIDVLGQEEEE